MKNLPPKSGCINNLQGSCDCEGVNGFANRPFVDIYNRSSAVFPVGGAMRLAPAGAQIGRRNCFLGLFCRIGAYRGRNPLIEEGVEVSVCS